MESIDSLYEAFRSVSKADWKAKVESDLKGKDPSELDWRDEDGLLHKAYYDRSDIENLKPLLSAKENSAWGIVQEYLVEEWEPKALKAHLSQSFSNGLQLAVLKGEEFSKDHWSVLNQDWKDSGNLKYFVSGRDLEEAIEERIGILIDPISKMVQDLQVDRSKLRDLDTYFKSQINEFNNQRFLLVEGSIYGKLGASAVQEIAYTLRHITEYFDLLTEDGHRTDAIARSLLINTSIGSSYFLQIAKFKALRHNLLKLQEYYQCETSINIWAESNSYYLDHENFNNNLIRMSAQAMSAVLGNCDNITLKVIGHSVDRKAFADRMSRNVQLILKHESYFDRVEDLIKGSYYVEDLSHQIAEKSWELFQKMEEQGALLELIEGENFMEDIAKMEEKRLASYKSKDQTLVAVNKYEHAEGISKDPLTDEDFVSLSQKLKH